MRLASVASAAAALTLTTTALVTGPPSYIGQRDMFHPTIDNMAHRLIARTFEGPGTAHHDGLMSRELINKHSALVARAGFVKPAEASHLEGSHNQEGGHVGGAPRSENTAEEGVTLGTESHPVVEAPTSRPKTAGKTTLVENHRATPEREGLLETKPHGHTHREGSSVGKQKVAEASETLRPETARKVRPTLDDHYAETLAELGYRHRNPHANLEGSSGSSGPAEKPSRLVPRGMSGGGVGKEAKVSPSPGESHSSTQMTEAEEKENAEKWRKWREERVDAIFASADASRLRTSAKPDHSAVGYIPGYRHGQMH